MSEYRYRLHTDSDGDCNEIEIEFPGFEKTWAWATCGHEKGEAWWEFDLRAIGEEMDIHYSIPYTKSPDLLETFFMRCIKDYQKLTCDKE